MEALQNWVSATVRLALVIAEMIDVVEAGEATEPANHKWEVRRRDVDEALVALRDALASG